MHSTCCRVIGGYKTTVTKVISAPNTVKAFTLLMNFGLCRNGLRSKLNRSIYLRLVQSFQFFYFHCRVHFGYRHRSSWNQYRHLKYLQHLLVKISTPLVSQLMGSSRGFNLAKSLFALKLIFYIIYFRKKIKYLLS